MPISDEELRRALRAAVRRVDADGAEIAARLVTRARRRRTRRLSVSGTSALALVMVLAFTLTHAGGTRAVVLSSPQQEASAPTLTKPFTKASVSPRPVQTPPSPPRAPITTVRCTMAWEQVTSDLSQNDDLAAIDGIGSADVWAVGSTSNGTTTLPLVEHWDGSAWSRADIPATVAPGVALTGVKAFAGNDVWAVGYSGSGASARPVIMHWDGSSWSVTQHPAQDVAGQLFSIDGTFSDDEWAVGVAHTEKDAIESPRLFEHWDGHAWTRLPDVASTGVRNPIAVAAYAATDAWSAGETVEHWNGATWHIAQGEGNASDIGGVSSHDIWLLGARSTNTNAQETEIKHWDGTSWRQIAAPPSYTTKDGRGDSHHLVSLVALGPKNVWAVGYARDEIQYPLEPVGASTSLVARWDGMRWIDMAHPSAPGDGVGLTKVVAVSARDLWAISSRVFVRMTIGCSH
jgi:hypothetical protein